MILLDDTFIYKINNYILGCGIIPILQKNESYYIFKVKYLLIFKENNEYNFETEFEALKKIKNIDDYLSLERHVNLDDSYSEKILYSKDKKKEI